MSPGGCEIKLFNLTQNDGNRLHKQERCMGKSKGNQKFQHDTLSNNNPCSIESFWNIVNFQDLQTKRNKQKIPQVKLTLNDSICQQSGQNDWKLSKTPHNYNNSLNKTAKIQSINPFQQILNQIDTPDFNLNHPFGFIQDFSKIQVKSPTFSDIFSSTQNLSPKATCENKMFFVSTKKGHHKENLQAIREKTYENTSRKQKIDQFKDKSRQMNKKQKKAQNEHQGQSIKQQVILKEQINQLKKSYVIPYKKLSSGYKLKNHFNSRTPKLPKHDQLSKDQKTMLSSCSKTCSVFNRKYQHVTTIREQNSCQASLLSNPEEQRSALNPIRINLFNPHDRKVLSEKSHQQFDHEGMQFKFKLKTSQKQNFTFLKKLNEQNGPKTKVQIKEEMEQIYKGKFKLQKTW